MRKWLLVGVVAVLLELAGGVALLVTCPFGATHLRRSPEAKGRFAQLPPDVAFHVLQPGRPRTPLEAKYEQIELGMTWEEISKMVAPQIADARVTGAARSGVFWEKFRDQDRAGVWMEIDYKDKRVMSKVMLQRTGPLGR